MHQERTTEPEPRLKIVTWGPVAAVLIAAAIFIGAQIAASLIVLIYGAVRGWSREQTLDWLGSANSGIFVAYVVTQVSVIGFVWWYVRYKKSGFRALGLTRPRPRDALLAVMGYGAYLPLFIVGQAVAKRLAPNVNWEQEQQLGFEILQTPPEFIFAFIALVVLPPLAEEILMRGFLYGGLKTKLPVIASALITSVVFAVLHLQIGSGTSLLWLAAIDTFILSLVLIYLREKTGRLWAPIGLHAVKNFIAYLVIFVFVDRL